MNITYTPKDPQAQVEENIIINGENVGTIRPYTPLYPSANKERYQASFSLPGMGLASGFGKTREEAISEAIDKGFIAAYASIDLLKKLKESVS